MQGRRRGRRCTLRGCHGAWDRPLDILLGSMYPCTCFSFTFSSLLSLSGVSGAQFTLILHLQVRKAQPEGVTVLRMHSMRRDSQGSQNRFSSTSGLNTDRPKRSNYPPCKCMQQFFFSVWSMRLPRPVSPLCSISRGQRRPS